MSYWVRNLWNSKKKPRPGIDPTLDEPGVERPAYETGYELVGTTSGIYGLVARVEGYDDSNIGTAGSGIMIGTNLVLTARHVVDDTNRYPSRRIDLAGQTVFIETTKVLRSADTSSTFRTNDLAVVKLGKDAVPAPRLVGIATIDGDPKASRPMLANSTTAGYPGNLYTSQS